MIEHDFIRTRDVSLHVAMAGPKDGPLLLMLHGFPEFWYAWRGYIEAFAEAGYRVVAPDQRGYGRSDKPKGIERYRLDELAADIDQLITALGREKAHLVGHDWGAGVAWWLAIKNPARVQKMVIMNVPHPTAMRQALLKNPRQILRSWYMFTFQLPKLPEQLFLRRDGALMVEMLKRTSRPGTFAPNELERYREAWRTKGAPTGMLNWYRASARQMTHGLSAEASRVKPPTLIIWGMADKMICDSLGPQSLAFCEQGRLEKIEGATHWLHHEEPERIQALIRAFFGPPVVLHAVPSAGSSSRPSAPNGRPWN